MEQARSRVIPCGPGFSIQVAQEHLISSAESTRVVEENEVYLTLPLLLVTAHGEERIVLFFGLRQSLAWVPANVSGSGNKPMNLN